LYEEETCVADMIEAGSAPRTAPNARRADDPGTGDIRDIVGTGAGTGTGAGRAAADGPRRDERRPATGAESVAAPAMVDPVPPAGAVGDETDDVEESEQDIDGSVVGDRAVERARDQDGAEADDGDDRGAGERGGVAGGSRTEELLVREGDLAGDYLERLLDLLDYDGDIDLDVEAGRAIVSIDGGEDLQKLVGSNGTVLEALQELTRLAVQQATGVRSRLMLDVAQWRAGRRTELARIGRDAAEKALSTGNAVKLAPMTPFERKIVHDAVARVDGVYSESEGEEPRRRVVVFGTA